MCRVGDRHRVPGGPATRRSSRSTIRKCLLCVLERLAVLSRLASDAVRLPISAIRVLLRCVCRSIRYVYLTLCVRRELISAWEPSIPIPPPSPITSPLIPASSAHAPDSC